MSEPPEQPRKPRSKGATYAGRAQQGAPNERPYTVYRSTPRSISARLRGESDAELEAKADVLSRQQPPRPPRAGGPDGPGGRGPGGPRDPRAPRPPRRGIRRIPGFGPSKYPPMHPIRWLKRLVLLVIFWVVLSAVLFFVSASERSGDLPGGQATLSALTGAGPMLFSPNNVLILGLDSRPTTGYSSKEGGGANHDELDANTDTIMIWRIGGGVSRRLSIPRDTLVNIPGYGMQKINAAWSCGGPKETSRSSRS